MDATAILKKIAWWPMNLLRRLPDDTRHNSTAEMKYNEIFKKSASIALEIAGTGLGGSPNVRIKGCAWAPKAKNNTITAQNETATSDRL
jgi:hypothetical protein